MSLCKYFTLLQSVFSCATLARLADKQFEISAGEGPTLSKRWHFSLLPKAFLLYEWFRWQNMLLILFLYLFLWHCSKLKNLYELDGCIVLSQLKHAFILMSLLISLKHRITQVLVSAFFLNLNKNNCDWSNYITSNKHKRQQRNRHRGGDDVTVIWHYCNCSQAKLQSSCWL